MVIHTHGKVDSYKKKLCTRENCKVYVLQSNHRKYLSNLHIHIDKIENKAIGPYLCSKSAMG